MIITFSGLGGSGKSTQIAIIKDTLVSNGKSVKIVALREFFFFPKFSKLFTKKEPGVSSGETLLRKKKFTSVQSAYLFCRDIFYILDTVRIGVYIKLISHKYDAIILDRAIDDFIMELDASSPWNGLHCFLVKCIPSATTPFFFSISSKTVFDRKAEDPLAVLEAREVIYENYFNNKSHIVSIDADQAVEVITIVLMEIINSSLASKKPFLVEGYLLYRALFQNDTSLLLSPVLKLSSRTLLSLASKNRSALAFLALIKNDSSLGVNFWNEEWNKYWSHALAVLNKREETLQRIPELFESLSYSLLKNDPSNIDLSSDIDAVFGNKKDYEKAVEVFTKLGTISIQSDRKADGYIENLIPVDLHYGLTFGSFEYFPSNVLSESAQVAGSAIVIAHAIAELTIVTMGDLLKTKEIILNKNLQQQIKTIASKNGWGNSYSSWLLRATSPELYGYNFSIFIPITPLVISRIGLYLKNPLNVNGLIKELWFLALSIRARRKGFIPFHDEWIKNVS